MKNPFLGIVAFSWALSMIACGDLSHSCTEIGCASDITFKLGDLEAAFPSGLPLSIKVCIDDSICGEVTLDAKAGAQPTCTAVETASFPFTTCSVAADGSVDVGIVPRAIENAEGAHEAHVTIRDAASAVVLDKTSPLSITEDFPNGEDCEGACYEGSVAFEP